jgi:hypothetical protein
MVIRNKEQTLVVIMVINRIHEHGFQQKSKTQFWHFITMILIFCLKIKSLTIKLSVHYHNFFHENQRFFNAFEITGTGGSLILVFLFKEPEPAVF